MECLNVELVFLREIFRQNGYSDQQIHRALNPPVEVYLPNNKPDSVTFLPYIWLIFNHITKVLSWNNTKLVGLLLRKTSGVLHSVSDDLGLNLMRVYSIPCECGQV